MNMKTKQGQEQYQVNYKEDDTVANTIPNKTQVTPTNQNTAQATPQGTQTNTQVTPQAGAQQQSLIGTPTSAVPQGTVGLRDALTQQGYAVDWTPQSGVTVNGQQINTQGMANVDGRLMVTPEQLQSTISGLTPQGQQPGALMPAGGLTRPSGDDLRNVAGGLGYKTTFDPNEGLVTVRDPNTGRSIQFESGQGREYGMAGLRDGYNVVGDQERFESFFQPTSASDYVNEVKNSFTETMKAFAETNNVDESVARIEESMTNTTSAMEGYITQMQEAINQIGNVEEPDTQAMVLNYLNQTTAIYDQMQRQLEQEREEGMDDPGLQSALGMMKEEYDFMRQQMLSNLRARGMDSGSELARAEARLSKGYMNSRQQMIGNFMSQLNNRVSQGLMQLMGQRAATLAQFGGMDIEQATAMADRRMQRLTSSLDAMSSLGTMYTTMGDVTMQGVGAIEGLKQGQQQVAGQYASAIMGEASQRQRFNEEMALSRQDFQARLDQASKTYGLDKEKLALMLKEFGLSEQQFERQDTYRTEDIAREERYRKEDIAREDVAIKEDTRRWEQEQALRERSLTSDENYKASKLALERASMNLNKEGIDAYKQALTDKIKLETTITKNDATSKALFESANRFNNELAQSPSGHNETYEEMIASGNVEKMRTAYDHLSQYTTYTDPFTKETEYNNDLRLFLNNLALEIDKSNESSVSPYDFFGALTSALHSGGGISSGLLTRR